MGSIKDYKTLGAAIERIVPGEGPDSPFAAGVGRYVSERFEADPETQDVVQAGLILLQSRDFVHLSPEEQNETLRQLEGHPSIALLARLCVEGYYTSPAGLADVGFRVTV